MLWVALGKFGIHQIAQGIQVLLVGVDAHGQAIVGPLDFQHAQVARIPQAAHNGRNQNRQYKNEQGGANNPPQSSAEAAWLVGCHFQLLVCRHQKTYVCVLKIEFAAA